MIRILHIMGGLKCGGIETSAVTCYRHIDRSVIQFDFLITTDSTYLYEKDYYEDEVIALGANIFRLPKRGKHPIRYIRAFRKLLHDNPDIKIIHIQRPDCMKAVFDSLLAMILGVKVRIVHGHNTFSNHKILHILFRPLLRLTTTVFMAASHEAGAFMFGQKNIKRLIIAPNARDYSIYRYNPEKRGIVRKEMKLEDNYVLVNIGRLSPEKNHLFLFDIIKNVAGKQPNVVLLLVGDGELKDELNRKAKESGIKNTVRLLGLRNDVPDLLQAADLFIMPSINEGLPGAAVEAQAAGLPCLLSDTISSETKITNDVEFLPIDKGSDIWADRIMQYKDFKRTDTSDIFINEAGDVRNAVKWWENLYLNVAENNEVT